MPFLPNEPQNGETVDADLLRENFAAVHEEATAPETDPVFAASEAALFVPGDKAKLDAGGAGFNPNAAGELYSCFGIFDGGNATNGVRLGGNQVDLQLYNMGQPVVVLSAGQKQLIGYPDYANPVPTVAAGWGDGVLRDGTGNAFLSAGTPAPGNPADWANAVPALPEAVSRLAAAYHALTGNPVP